MHWSYRIQIANGIIDALLYLKTKKFNINNKIVSFEYHRNLFSGNVLLTQECVPKLICYGLSNNIPNISTTEYNEKMMKNSKKNILLRIIDFVASSLPTIFSSDADEYDVSTRSKIGHSAYQCPEYLQTGVFNEKSEIYSVGVVMAELFSGRNQLTEVAFHTNLNREIGMYLLKQMYFCYYIQSIFVR